MGKLKLDADEAQLLEDFEGGALQSVATRKELDRLRNAAQATALKDKRVNIRLSAVDLQAIQARALADGLPYQTFMASVLHKFVAGRLRETEGASATPLAQRRRDAGLRAPVPSTTKALALLDRLDAEEAKPVELTQRAKRRRLGGQKARPDP